MKTFAIGDIQGCFRTFQELLKKIEFDPKQDHLILVGDLINRGAHSVDLAQWVLANQGCVSAVLGNHDVHYLAIWDGVGTLGKKDSVQGLLESSLADDFATWLLAQSFYLERGEFSVAHAGILPQWSLEQAREQSDTLMSLLRGEDRRAFLKSYRDDVSQVWPAGGSLFQKCRFALSAFTRMRVCSKSGALDFSFNGELAQMPDSLIPWFRLRDVCVTQPVVFGHWAALGNYTENNCYGIDSGCVWGGSLSALNLETRKRTSVPALSADLLF